MSELKPQKHIAKKVCIFCNGTGLIDKYKKRRKKCSECGDHNHGCFGSGREDGLGEKYCTVSELVYTDQPNKPTSAGDATIAAILEECERWAKEAELLKDKLDVGGRRSPFYLHDACELKRRANRIKQIIVCE